MATARIHSRYIRTACDLPCCGRRVWRCLVERAANGHPLIADLRRTTGAGVPSPTPVVPRGSKTERMAIRSHLIEAGDVLLPEKAPWLDEFRNELTAFPHGRHDDQVDALSQLLGWVEDRKFERRVSTAAPIIIY